MDTHAGHFLGAFVFLGVGVGLVIAPGLFLFLGWSALGSRRYGVADTMATLAGLTSVAMGALAGLIGLLAVLVQDNDGSMLALVVVPAIAWLLSRALHDSIRVRREADRLARRA